MPRTATFEAAPGYPARVECSVCFEPWEDPIQLPQCEHIFCRRCVASIVAAAAGRSFSGPSNTNGNGAVDSPDAQVSLPTNGGGSCPECRVRFAVVELKEPHRVLTQQALECEGTCSACPFSGTREQWVNHKCNVPKRLPVGKPDVIATSSMVDVRGDHRNVGDAAGSQQESSSASPGFWAAVGGLVGFAVGVLVVGLSQGGKKKHRDEEER